MGWAKFDDQFTDHPKVVAAGPWAELLAMRAIIHCARHETDGHVQAAQLPRLALGITSAKKQVAALVRAGLWREDPDGDGWWVHDFLDYHPSREDKEAEREAARDRMRNVRAKRRRSSSDVRPNTQTNGERTSPYPDPAPPAVPDGTELPPQPPTASPQGEPVENVVNLNSRANGTNPRAQAARAQADQAQAEKANAARSYGHTLATLDVIACEDDALDAIRAQYPADQADLAEVARLGWLEATGGRP